MEKSYSKQYLFPLGFALIVFIGFELMAVLLKEEDYFSYSLIGSLLFLLVLMTSGFTFRLQKRRRIELLPYLIHPLFLFGGLFTFLVFSENDWLKQATILGTALSYFVLFSEKFSDLTHHFHDGVKFLIIFLLYNSILEGVHFFGLSLYFVPLLILILTLLLQIHMLWRLEAFKRIFILIALLVSSILALAVWILLDFYLFSSYLVLSLILVSIYYLCWGVVHHLIEKNLTLKIFLEYFFIFLMILLMFLGLTTGF